jgi:hypothetical protein
MTCAMLNILKQAYSHSFLDTMISLAQKTINNSEYVSQFVSRLCLYERYQVAREHA